MKKFKLINTDLIKSVFDYLTPLENYILNRKLLNKTIFKSNNKDYSPFILERNNYRTNYKEAFFLIF